MLNYNCTHNEIIIKEIRRERSFHIEHSFEDFTKEKGLWNGFDYNESSFEWIRGKKKIKIQVEWEFDEDPDLNVNENDDENFVKYTSVDTEVIIEFTEQGWKKITDIFLRGKTINEQKND
jgi:hypothetical protein